MIQFPLVHLQSAIDEENIDLVVALLQTLPTLKNEEIALTYLKRIALYKNMSELTRLIHLGDWELQFQSMYSVTGWEFLEANGYEGVKHILTLPKKSESFSWNESVVNWSVTAAHLLTGYAPRYSESTAYFRKDPEKLTAVCLPHLRFTCKSREMVVEITSILDLFGISYDDALIKDNRHLVTVAQEGLLRLNDLFNGFCFLSAGLGEGCSQNFKKEKIGYYYKFSVNLKNIIEEISLRIQKNTDFKCKEKDLLKDNLMRVSEGCVNSFASDWVASYTPEVESKEHYALALFAKKYGLPVWDSTCFQNMPLEQGARLFYLLMSKVEPQEQRCLEVYRASVCAHLPDWIRDSKIPTAWQEIVSFGSSVGEAEECEQPSPLKDKLKFH